MTLRELLTKINEDEKIQIQIIKYNMYFNTNYIFKGNIKSKEILDKKVKNVQSFMGAIKIEVE